MIDLVFADSLIGQYWLHPLHGDGYQLWSGILSDVGEVTLATAIFSHLGLTWHRYNCAAKGCLRIGRHPVPGTHHVTCRRHAPHLDDQAPSAERIAADFARRSLP